jgi:hypothetical protein
VRARGILEVEANTMCIEATLTPIEAINSLESDKWMLLCFKLDEMDYLKILKIG